MNILIGGEAGQGLASIGDILAKTLVREGYRIVVTQDYMSRVRGGHNAFIVRVSPDDLQAPEEKIDLLVALNAETVDIHRQELASKSLIIAEQKLKIKDKNCLSAPLHEFSEPKFQNVAGLAVAAAVIGLDEQALIRAVGDYFGDKSGEVIAKNEQAVKKAYAWAASAGHEFTPLQKPAAGKGRIMLNGNQAIALGALSAGLKFYAFYPMTPATSIGVTLAGQMARLPVVAHQAEDEIAAMNMAIAASYAGAPSMVGTSGGGFALMIEAVSLAGVSETPVVVALAQRPGPATGMPTRTEQGELDFIIHAGHGEFPRAVFAPGNIEQCFHLTRQAFTIAELAQTPAFVMTDLFLTDSYRAVDPFDVDKLDPITPGADPDSVQKPYQRYRITDSGVSPRLIPLRSPHLIRADCHEHYEHSLMDEEAGVRTRMVDKRMRKMDIIRREAVAPEFMGDDRPDLLLVCWGSTRGSALEAAAMVRESGRKAAVLHFSQVWPLVPEQFLSRLQNAKQAVCVESNAQGQFARLIRRESGFEIKKKILKYDGRVITPEYIVNRLEGDK